jgi:peptidase M42 family hydrolase
MKQEQFILPDGPAPSFAVDRDYLQSTLLDLLSIHSPTGYTDPVVRFVCSKLAELGIPTELTRRGAIRARLTHRSDAPPSRALVAHLDTLGALVRGIKPNGRLALAPVGTWSARFAEGARVSIFTDSSIHRGTILPLKASGHTYNELVDTQPVSWDNLEVRVDENVSTPEELHRLGFRVGDFIGVDSQPEILPNGFINARHLDDKAGVAALLAAAKFIFENDTPVPAPTSLLFTISEEVGSGASAVLSEHIAEMVSIDNGTVAPDQASREFGVTIAMADSTGPFDYHLTRHLLHLCREYRLVHARDVYRHYRSDSASALDAGNDTRTALATFGVDASHGYERTHMDSLVSIAQLAIAYLSGPMLFEAQTHPITTIEEFPETRTTGVETVTPANQEVIATIPPAT